MPAWYRQAKAAKYFVAIDGVQKSPAEGAEPSVSQAIGILRVVSISHVCAFFAQLWMHGLQDQIVFVARSGRGVLVCVDVASRPGAFVGPHAVVAEELS